METLKLGRNNIARVEAGAFEDLKTLEELYLFGNAISTLEPDVFQCLTSLKSLGLEVNRMERLEAGVFEGLDSLSWLNLSFNRLTALDPGLFEGLTALRTLRLAGNPADPLAITISLKAVGAGGFRAEAHTGAPFDIVLSAAGPGGPPRRWDKRRHHPNRPPHRATPSSSRELPPIPSASTSDRCPAWPGTMAATPWSGPPTCRSN